MIKRITDSDKFICNVISVTGKMVEQKEFNSFEEACSFRNQKLKLKNIEDVEIYSSKTNYIPFACEDAVEEEAPVEKCCICGKELEDCGSTPYPIAEEGKCCDECNLEFVLPARKLQNTKPYKDRYFVKCKKCGLPVILASDVNKCKCGECYNASGRKIVIEELQEDTFEEVSKAIYTPKKPLAKKKLNISTETAQKLAQATTFVDSRDYQGEYYEKFWERYKGTNVYRKELGEDNFEFYADYLGTEVKAKTLEELEEKLDKAIEKYIDAYKADFEIKQVKEIKKDLTKGE